MTTNTPATGPVTYYASVREAEEAVQAAGYQRRNGVAWVKDRMEARVIREAPGKFYISAK